MTAVPVQRSKTKDPFQIELDKEIAKRKGKGYNTGFSDEEDDVDDAYEDDFVSGESSDDELLKQYLQPSTSKKAIPSTKRSQSPTLYGYDNALNDRSFLKGHATSHLSSTIRSPLGRQQAVENFDGNPTSNPLLSLLEEKPHTSTKGILKKGSSTFNQPLSPRYSQDVNFKKHSRFDESTLSPRDRPLSPTATLDKELMTSSVHPVAHNNAALASTRLTESQYASVSRAALQQEKEMTALHHSMLTRPLSPSVHSPRTRLSKTDEIAAGDNVSTPRSTASMKGKDSSNFTSDSIIDYLLDDSKPKPAPRKKEGTAEIEKPFAKIRNRHDSEKSSGSDRSTKRKSPSSPEQQHLKSIENTTSKESSYLDFMSSLPSLDKPSSQNVVGEKRDATKEIARKSPRTRSPEPSLVERSPKVKSPEPGPAQRSPQTRSPVSGPAARSRKVKSPEPGQTPSLEQTDSSSVNDLVALFEQTTVSAAVPQRDKGTVGTVELNGERKMEPAEAVAQITAEQHSQQPLKRRSSQQLLENVIENVAVHNETYVIDKDAMMEDDKKDKTPKRPSSVRPRASKKSPRTPSANYKGLGSLTGLQQLKTYDLSTNSVNLNSTADLRTMAYLQWLTDREKKLKEKKETQLEEEEKENEKKEKERQEKMMEDKSARNAWMQQKDVLLKEEQQRRRKEANRIRREKMKAEEEKWKSEKKANIVRERALEEAKKRHRAEMKKKREEEMIKKQKEEDKKKENEKAMNKWMEKRSKQWEQGRKKELREKKKQEKEKNISKEEKSTKSQEEYQKWQEKKEKQLKERRKVNYHDEERPAWSPANKVIPRTR